MSYELLDPIIFPWTQKHTLYVHTNYKDEEVRSIEVNGAKGERFQIWIDPPLGTLVNIHASNYKTNKDKIAQEWIADVTILELVLEEVLQTVKNWMK